MIIEFLTTLVKAKVSITLVDSPVEIAVTVLFEPIPLLSLCLATMIHLLLGFWF